MTDALATLAAQLRCPNCGAPLQLRGAALRCASGHSYDVARAGHVTLPAPGRRLADGDTPAMVAARERVLGAGHFEPVTAAVLAAAACIPPRERTGAWTIADLGAGTGHHLAALLHAEPQAWGVALDTSRPALRRALRAHPRIAAVVCDVWRGLPLRDASVGLAIDVFAPRNGAEIARVLSPDGTLIVVTPTERHLGQIVARFGLLQVAEDKPSRIRATLAPALVQTAGARVEFTLALARAQVKDVIAMGPSAHHLQPGQLDALLAEHVVGDTEVTVSVNVESFRLLAR